MNGLVTNIVVSVGSTVAVAALTLLFQSVRTAVFYRRVEYDLTCERRDQSSFSCTWDIHWEDYRLTFEAGDISDDKIKAVTFQKLGGKTETLPELFPSDSFRPLFNKEIYVKLNSIVRFKPPVGNRVYTLRLVFRRRRFF